ncbi:MAG TPA: hypothetical protein VF484_11420 [Candidatus Limnocylindrales bacterium]
MSDARSPEQTTAIRHSRRAVLAGIAGGAAALAAHALDHPLPVAAAGDDGAILHVGDTIADAQSQTTLANKANDGRVLWVASNNDLGHGNGIAVTGYSTGKIGVEGLAGAIPASEPSNVGVFGYSAGTGVSGQTTTGTGVSGAATDPTGIAIKGSGRVQLGKVSGVTSIAANTTSRTLTLAVDVVSTAFVLLSPRTNIGARSLYYTVDATNNKITIHISSSRTTTTYVAWLLIG